jgi:hypothetical protein
MSGLLFGIGAFAVAVGIVMIGFGIPISEFSFGNTLIIAGTTAAVGGLIVAGLGVVVAQLQRLADALANRAPIRASRPADMVDSRTTPAASQIPFPPKPKPDAGNREPYPLGARNGPPMPANMPIEPGLTQSFAPTLRNPDEAPETVEDEVSLSPQHPMATPAPAAADLGANTPPRGFNGSGLPEKRHEPTLDADWQPEQPPAAPAPSRQPHTAYFDTMWPAESKQAKRPAGSEDNPEPKRDLTQRETSPATSKRAAEPDAPIPRAGNETRAVAILKSGVVDGMGYTLYVDGSIEAELPQGTLRFASINELRSHLENNA